MENSLKSLERDTVIVPVVTLEDVLVPTDRERAELVASLKQAEAEVAAGKAKASNRETFKRRFLAICKGEIA